MSTFATPDGRNKLVAGRAYAAYLSPRPATLQQASMRDYFQRIAETAEARRAEIAAFELVVAAEDPPESPRVGKPSERLTRVPKPPPKKHAGDDGVDGDGETSRPGTGRQPTKMSKEVEQRLNRPKSAPSPPKEPATNDGDGAKAAKKGVPLAELNERFYEKQRNHHAAVREKTVKKYVTELRPGSARRTAAEWDETAVRLCSTELVTRKAHREKLLAKRLPQQPRPDKVLPEVVAARLYEGPLEHLKATMQALARKEEERRRAASLHKAKVTQADWDARLQRIASPRGVPAA